MSFPAGSASAKGKCATTGPLDVCKTPTPAGPQPVPYPNLGMTSDASGSSKVRIGSKDALRKGDKLSKSMGDNAGTAGGGMKSSKFMGKIALKDGCGKVKFQGKAAAYVTIVTEHNDGNAPGLFACPSQTKVNVVGPPGPGASCANAGGSGPAGAGDAASPGAGGGAASDAKKDSAASGASDRCKEKPIRRKQLPKTPNPATNQHVNDKRTQRWWGVKSPWCPTCNRDVSINSKVDRFVADHIVPVAEISRMNGFSCLSREDQSEILNMNDNMFPTCHECNIQRQDTFWGLWKGSWEKMPGPDRLDHYNDMVKERYPRLKERIGKKIQDRIPKGKGKCGLCT